MSQILISLVSSFFVIFGVLSALDLGKRSTTHARHLVLADEAADFVAALLIAPKYCTAHLQGTLIPSSVPVSAKNNIILKDLTDNGALGSRTVLGVGSKFKNILKISSLDLNIDHQVGPQRFLASLVIGVEGAHIGFFNHIERSVSLFVTTDSAGRINGCSRLNYQTFSGKGFGEFSKTCNDFAAKGWPSKETCIRDGRWHLVYTKHPQASDATYGSPTEFAQYVMEGADSHVIALHSDSSMTGSYRCQGIEVRSADNMNQFACHEPYRIELANWEKNSGSFRSLHGATWFSEGLTNKPNKGPAQPVETEWYVRF